MEGPAQFSPLLASDSDPTASMEPPTKLDGWALYRQMGSPKHIVAPMVDASELAWRVFSRSPVESCNQPAAQLAYTPMIHARLFSVSSPLQALLFRLLRMP